MYCMKCGQKLSDGDRFCPRCGNNIMGTPAPGGAASSVLSDKPSWDKGTFPCFAYCHSASPSLAFPLDWRI